MTSRAIGAAVVPPVPLWFWRTTATASSAGLSSSSPANAMNHVMFEPGHARLARPGLAADRIAGDLGGRSGAALDATRIISATASAVSLLTARRMSVGRCSLDHLPAGGDDAVDDLRLHQPSADADRTCHHRHSGAASRACAPVRRPCARRRRSSRPSGNRAFRCGRARSRGARRRASRAAVARRSRSAWPCPGSSFAPSFIPMLQKTEFTEWVSASLQGDRPERTGRVEVVHLLSVDGAVARGRRRSSRVCTSSTRAQRTR